MIRWLYRHRVRILLNILAWGFLFNAAYNNSSSYYAATTAQTSFALHAICYNLLFLAVSSINTFWLMPRYFITRRYGTYCSLVGVLALLFTVVISRYNVWMTDHFPGLEDGQFSSISISMKTEDMSWADYYLSVAPSVLLTLFVFSIGFLMQEYFRVRQQQDIIVKKQVESELSLLKSQINPHFLFNVLNSIYALSLKKSDNTPNIVLRLSDMLRYMLYEARQEKVALEKELEMIENYIDIEKVRIGSGQQLSLTVNGDPAAYRIAPMLLLPFVENAVKHGIDSMSEHAYAHIAVTIEEGMLQFYCSNNFRQPGAQRTGGIGLENVGKRLELIYPGRHSLQVKTESTIFTVTLTLMLN